MGGAKWEACRDELIDELQQAQDWAQREETLLHDVYAAPPRRFAGRPRLPPQPRHPRAFSRRQWRSNSRERHSEDSSRAIPKRLSVLYQGGTAPTRSRQSAVYPASTAGGLLRFCAAGQMRTVALRVWIGGRAIHMRRRLPPTSGIRNPDMMLSFATCILGTPWEIRQLSGYVADPRGARR